MSPIASPNFHFSRYLDTPRAVDRRPLDWVLNISVYSPLVYRSLKSIGVLWLDENGDSRWNEVAERRMSDYLGEKQRLPKNFFDDEKVNECLRRQFLVFDQYEAGFFSRHNRFLHQFGQSLCSSSMVVLSYRWFSISGAGQEFFRGEGVLRYFSAIFSCSFGGSHPRMNSILRHLKGEMQVIDWLWERSRIFSLKRNVEWKWNSFVTNTSGCLAMKMFLIVHGYSMFISLCARQETILFPKHFFSTIDPNIFSILLVSPRKISIRGDQRILRTVNRLISLLFSSEINLKNWLFTSLLRYIFFFTFIISHIVSFKWLIYLLNIDRTIWKRRTMELWMIWPRSLFVTEIKCLKIFCGWNVIDGDIFLPMSKVSLMKNIDDVDVSPRSL